MIKADHKKWARRVYDFYEPWLLKSNFQNFYLINDFPQIPANEGLIITPNHFSWWDGFFIDYTLRFFSSRKIYILMLEEQLKRYWFFQKVGAFSINPQNPKSIKETLDYISEVVSDPNNVLLFYPQGEIDDYAKRPLKVKDGLKTILNMSPAIVNILPVAFKIKHGNTKKPDILVRFGDLISSYKAKTDFNFFIAGFNSNIDLLDKELSNNYKDNLFTR
ncbi:MAG: 1-acyl-sn-glycerol-3-phosphate acyltransferase [Ignavibacteriaceae bacterium]|nr:1-acyl-sn-glycerol-3-phosphate acyltransferase [Ignavibacteriaceae bacterium]